MKWITVAERFVLMGLLSGLLLKDLCPAWYLALTVTIAAFQLSGFVLLRALRPHLESCPPQTYRANAILNYLWIAVVFLRGSEMPAPVFALGYSCLALTSAIVLLQQLQQGAIHLIPLRAPRR